jgi:hypothetical protein
MIGILKAKDQLHKSIDTLSIWAYNRIVDTNDTGYLYTPQKDGDDLSKVYWTKIINEYIAATSHREENKDVYAMQHHLFELAIEYNSVRAMVFVMQIQPNADAAQRLEQLGYDADDLKGTLAASSNLLTQRREVEMELAGRLIGKKQNGTFEHVLDKISQHQKIRLNPREITVKEWIAIEDNYLKDMRHASN